MELICNVNGARAANLLSIAPCCQARTRNEAVYALPSDEDLDQNLHDHEILIDREAKQFYQISVWFESDVVECTDAGLEWRPRGGRREMVDYLRGPLDAHLERFRALMPGVWRGQEGGSERKAIPS